MAVWHAPQGGNSVMTKPLMARRLSAKLIRVRLWPFRPGVDGIEDGVVPGRCAKGWAVPTTQVHGNYAGIRPGCVLRC